MPIIPAPPAAAPVEIAGADEDTPFDVTLAVADAAEDLVTVPATKEGKSISVVNEGVGTVYLAFDADATTADLALNKGDSYSDSGLAIASRVSFIGESGKTPRCRGVLWSG